MYQPFMILLFLVLLIITAFAQSVHAADPGEARSLPGYYQFFMKMGGQVRIQDEVKRDEEIDSGSITPQTMKMKMPSLALPLASGKKIKFSDYVGKKNVVVVSFRSWW